MSENRRPSRASLNAPSSTSWSLQCAGRSTVSRSRTAMSHRFKRIRCSTQNHKGFIRFNISVFRISIRVSDLWAIESSAGWIRSGLSIRCSYAAAKRMVMPDVEHRSHNGLNNRAENFHVPIRKRERIIQGFRSWPELQRFVSTFFAVRNHFVPPRSHRSALSFTFIASRRLRNGNPLRPHPRGVRNRGLIAPVRSLRDIAVRKRDRLS